MTPRHRLFLAIFFALAMAAWLNASQERQAGCKSCSPMAATLDAMACDSKTLSR